MRHDGDVMSRYLQAAAQGNYFAQNNLGIVYKNGMAVAMDLAKAFEWFMKAAEQVGALLRFLSLFYHDVLKINTIDF